MVKESSAFIAEPSKEKRWLTIRKMKLPDSFQGEVFKGNIWGEGCRVHDFLLIGWWWGYRVVFQESQSSTFWFQPVWGLCSDHPPPGWGVLFFLQNNSKVCIRLLCISLGEELGLLLSLNYCFLTAFPLFLHSLTSLISDCLRLLFGTQGRPRRPKPFSRNKKGGGGKQRGFCTQEGPRGSCSVSVLPPLWYSSILRRTGGRTRKRIKFWVERLIINLAGETWF